MSLAAVEVPNNIAFTDELALLNDFYDQENAEVILEYALSQFQDKISLVSSFGADSAVLLRMIADLAPNTPVLFLDTGFHFSETLEHRDQLIAQLGLTNVQSLHAQPNILSMRDPINRLHREDPDSCCEIRKTSVLQEALLPYTAWISGRKRFQTKHRQELKVFELDREMRIKVNPLAAWTASDVDLYLEKNNLPRHPLWDMGYRSVGCEPCTAPSFDSEDARAGRWAGCGKTECGIHL